MIVATVTGGTIIGVVVLAVLLLACLGGLIYALFAAREGRWFGVALAVLCALVCIGAWWWGMAFTLSGDYHAWNVKEGRVEAISKRLVPAGDKSMQERFVLKIDGEPYGVDDTRAALAKVGDEVSLRCKKDWQWGIPREAHGWGCRWNGVTP